MIKTRLEQINVEMDRYLAGEGGLDGRDKREQAINSYCRRMGIRRADFSPLKLKEFLTEIEFQEAHSYMTSHNLRVDQWALKTLRDIWKRTVTERLRLLEKKQHRIAFMRQMAQKPVYYNDMTPLDEPESIISYAVELDDIKGSARALRGVTADLTEMLKLKAYKRFPGIAFMPASFLDHALNSPVAKSAGLDIKKTKEERLPRIIERAAGQYDIFLIDADWADRDISTVKGIDIAGMIAAENPQAEVILVKLDGEMKPGEAIAASRHDLPVAEGREEITAFFAQAVEKVLSRRRLLPRYIQDYAAQGDIRALGELLDDSMTLDMLAALTETARDYGQERLVAIFDRAIRLHENLEEAVTAEAYEKAVRIRDSLIKLSGQTQLPLTKLQPS